MKKIIFSIILFLVALLPAHATLHTVTVSNFQFSPQTISNVVVGDIIEWVWGSGFHTTTSVTIPGGAASWDAPITSSATSFQYTVTVVGTYNYVCSVHPGMTASFTATATTPVVMTDFKVNNNGNQTILKWKTSSEQNSDYFSIKRSVNGTDFIQIGRVNAAGTSNVERAYTFNDSRVTANKYLYYLIEITDIDGRTQFSETRLVRNASAASKIIVSITPNPIIKPGHMLLKFNADENGTMQATVSDIQGRLLLATTLSTAKGVNNGHIHLGEIAPGTYNIVFTLDGIKETHRIVVK